MTLLSIYFTIKQKLFPVVNIGYSRYREGDKGVLLNVILGFEKLSQSIYNAEKMLFLCTFCVMPKVKSPYLHLYKDAKAITETLIDILVDLRFASVSNDNTFSFIEGACRKEISRNPKIKGGLSMQKSTQKNIEEYFNAIIKGLPITQVKPKPRTVSSLCSKVIKQRLQDLDQDPRFEDFDFSLQKTSKANPVVPNQFSEAIDALEYFTNDGHIKPKEPVVILCPIDDMIADFYQGVFCATTWSAVTISLQPLSEEVSWMLELRKKEMLEKHTQKRVQQYFSLLTEK